MSIPKVYNKHGKNYPKGAIYIGRPTKFGNPYPVRKHTLDEHLRVVGLYCLYLDKHPELIKQAKVELKGKNLLCYCKPLPCHGDILITVANRK